MNAVQDTKNTVNAIEYGSRHDEVGTRNVAIFIFDDVEVLDFAGPFEVFNVAGELIPREPFPAFFTYTVGLTGDLVVARGGLRVTPHFSVANCPQPDLLIIPGGYGARRLLKNPAFLDWLQRQSGQVERLMSVCTGALALGRAGLLNGLAATTHHDSFDLLAVISPQTEIRRGARYVDNGRVVTSAGVSAGIDMALAVLEQLVGAEKTKLVTDEMEWMWGDRG